MSVSSDHLVLGCTALVGAVVGGGAYTCLSSATKAGPAVAKAAAKVPSSILEPAVTVGSEGGDQAGSKTVTVKRGTESVEIVWKPGKDVAVWRQLRTNFSVDTARVMELKQGSETVAVYDDVESGAVITLDLQDSLWRDASNQLRKEGNERFTRGNQTSDISQYIEALKLYRRAYQLLPPDGGDDASHLFCLAKSNCAQICLKCNMLTDCRAVCSEVLKKDPRNTKALYRRGVAAKRLGPNNLGMLQEALNDFKQALEISAQNSDLAGDIRRERDEVQQLLTRLMPAQETKPQDPKLSGKYLECD
eukprot:TRINITY_DN7261_c0_g2_i1.p1 TRINITY_DN7261_c0_g2~~TRINITY_DN7261_c0_g2_i1.p1  ORF type:complete len:305 (+),score=116.11 TRINITY_DN7261_c0_g2_i1:139-1053(+)